MENSIKIDTFPITGDMYQLKSIDIINSNFLSLKKWHDAFDVFCKLDNTTGDTRLYIEGASCIDTEDLKVNHIQSKEEYNPSGSTHTEYNRLFEISKNIFKWKGFIVDDDGITLPMECIHPIDDGYNSIERLNTQLKNAGSYANGLIWIILNVSSDYVFVSISNHNSIGLNPGDAMTIICYEGSWFCLGKTPD